MSHTETNDLLDRFSELPEGVQVVATLFTGIVLVVVVFAVWDVVTPPEDKTPMEQCMENWRMTNTDFCAEIARRHGIDTRP